MPVYEYECDDCSHRFERQQRFSDPPVTSCPQCAGAVRKVFHPASVIFKGSGWYVTDNRPSNGKSEKEGGPKPSEKMEKKSDEAKAAGTAKSGSGDSAKSSSPSKPSSAKKK